MLETKSERLLMGNKEAGSPLMSSVSMLSCSDAQAELLCIPVEGEG